MNKTSFVSVQEQSDKGNILVSLRGNIRITVKLHYEEIYNLSSLFSIIRVDKSRRMKSVGHEKKINMYKILARTSKRKIPHGRLNMYKWKDNIKKFLR
jgi:hypothetical protein